MKSGEAHVQTTEAFICFFVRGDMKTEIPGVKQLKCDAVHLPPLIAVV
jgi:hypothetical protein